MNCTVEFCLLLCNGWNTFSSTALRGSCGSVSTGTGNVLVAYQKK